MSSNGSKILVTAASGQLGRLVVAALVKKVGAENVIAAARKPGSIADIAAQGVEVRAADYSKPETLDAAFAGVSTLLLISSSEIGARAVQHGNAIAAAKKAGAGLIAYTSILHADVSPIGIAEEHRQTEAALAASGVPFVLLRNGWYTENYDGAYAPAIASGTYYGAAGEGRVSSAARADYAEAAAVVLASAESQAGKVYELAGDDAFTLAELAAEVATVSGKPVAYVDLPEAALRDGLAKAGFPEPVAALLADFDVGTAKGALFDDGRELSVLIGRSTTPWRETVAKTLRG